MVAKKGLWWSTRAASENHLKLKTNLSFFQYHLVVRTKGTYIKSGTPALIIDEFEKNLRPDCRKTIISL